MQTKKIENMVFQKVRPQTRENILKSYNLNSELQDENGGGAYHRQQRNRSLATPNINVRPTLLQIAK